MPGLPFSHFFGATVVIADIWYRVDQDLSVKLQSNPEGPVHGRMVWPEIKEHELRGIRLALHSPLLRVEQKRILLECFLFIIKRERLHLSRPGRMFFAQRMPLPGWRQHNAEQVRVPFEFNTEHVPRFTLIPVGARPEVYGGRQLEISIHQRHLHPDVTVPGEGCQMVDHGEF